MVPPSTDASAQAEDLRALLAAHFREQKLDLPMLPDSSARVVDLCDDESCDARQLAALIQRDPALAGHVLRIANSALYAPKEPIVSLQQAIGRLGMAALKSIALAAALQSRIFHAPGREARLRALWVHSAAAGVWAKEVARARRRNVESAFLCGLLHEVGKPVVMQAAIEVARAARAPLPDALCEELMAEFHGQVGGALLRHWKLPEWMAAAVVHHHRCEEAGDHAEHARTAHLADRLAHVSLGGGGAGELRALPVLERLDLYADEFDLLLGRAEDVLRACKALA